MKRMIYIFLILSVLIVTGTKVAEAVDMGNGNGAKYADLFDKAKDYPLNIKIRDEKEKNKNVYYKIQTTSNDSYYSLRSRTNSLNDYVRFELLDETGANIVIAFSTDVNDGKVLLKLKPNSTYYLVAYESKKSTTKYILHIREIIDDFADTLEEAKNRKGININKTYKKYFQSTTDVDYIKFQTNAAQKYIINAQISDPYRVNFTLFDSEGKQIEFKEVPLSNLRMYMEVKLKPNATYYLKAEFISGHSYRDFDYDFSIVQADAFQLNKAQITLTKGQSYTLQVSSKVGAESVNYIRWLSSDSSMISTEYLENYQSSYMNKITALKKGKAKITCWIHLKDGSFFTVDSIVTIK